MLSGNDMNEVWAEIEGYEGRYQVSNHGRVRSIQTNHGQPCERLKVLAKSGTVDYLYVKLYIKGVMTNHAVHRLVAKAFVPNPNDKPMVNHKDGDKSNNHASNLEWATCSENHKHAYACGLRNAGHLAARQLGVKLGTKSRFHNVSWDASRCKWKAGIKHKGRTLAQKRFDSETAAALFVNDVLDQYGLTDRPRNIVT